MRALSGLVPQTRCSVTDLTILCVTKAEHYSIPFLTHFQDCAFKLGAALVLAADGDQAFETLSIYQHVIQVNNTGPSLEGVLDQAVGACDDGYILRMDDDERLSTGMFRWLYRKRYTLTDHWSFPRVWWWERPGTMVYTPELFPDYQTRLSIKEKAGGRSQLHAGSPWGFGIIAPVFIEHHKFLIKDYVERAAIADRYERFHPGFGRGRFLGYSLPEDAYPNIPILEIL